MKHKLVFAVAFTFLCFTNLFGQARGQAPAGGGRGGAAPAPPTPQAAAPIDLTGYWVAVVTEDWRWRMVTPPKGDFASIPTNPAGVQAGQQWDPAKDEAAGEQCKSYGAAAIMRVPGRLHITWDNDTTLKIDTEAGTQTRLLHFGGQVPAADAPSWQGYSVAQWENAAVAAGEPRNGDLKVVTTRMRPGYLRKNGVPYSGDAVLTEWYDRHTAPNGDVWLVVTTQVADAQNLT